MAGDKGVGVVFIRRLVRERGEGAEAQLRQALSIDDVRVLERATATEWLPVEFANRLAEAAAPILFPDAADPLEVLGRQLALDNMRGIYAWLVRVMTVEFIARQSAPLWSVYHDAGEATTEVIGERTLRYSIRGYPSMPVSFRRYIGPFVAQVIEMTGAQGVSVVLDENADSWGYVISWRA